MKRRKRKNPRPYSSRSEAARALRWSLRMRRKARTEGDRSWAATWDNAARLDRRWAPKRRNPSAARVYKPYLTPRGMARLIEGEAIHLGAHAAKRAGRHWASREERLRDWGAYRAFAAVRASAAARAKARAIPRVNPVRPATGKWLRMQAEAGLLRVATYPNKCYQGSRRGWDRHNEVYVGPNRTACLYCKRRVR